MPVIDLGPSWLNTAVALVVAYLVGGIPFGFLIGRACGVDIRDVGSGNIGATNVWRTVGKPQGLVAFGLDVGKGLVAVLVIGGLFGQGQVPMMRVIAAGLGAILGHVFPVYLGFRGGKAVATSLGVVISLAPAPTLIAFATFVVVVGIWRYISLGSITAAMVVAVATPLMTPDPFGANLVLTCFIWLIAALVIVRHRTNIGRLIRGTERTFGMGKTTATHDDEATKRLNE